VEFSHLPVVNPEKAMEVLKPGEDSLNEACRSIEARNKVGLMLRSSSTCSTAVPQIQSEFFCLPKTSLHSTPQHLTSQELWHGELRHHSPPLVSDEEMRIEEACHGNISPSPLSAVLVESIRFKWHPVSAGISAES